MPQTTALIDELKRTLKAHGLTYREVGQSLGLSEASVKRMFSRRRFTLDRLEQVLGLMQLGIGDLVERARSGRERISQLTPDQEEALVSDPRMLLMTFLVVNRWRVEDILKAYTLTEAEIQSLLIRLDRLNVIELLPFNRYRLLTARNFSWRPNGPVQQAFVKHIQGEFFDSRFNGKGERLRFLTGGLSDAGIEHFNDRLDQLMAEFDELVERDATLPFGERRTCSAVLAMRPIGYSMFAGFRATGHPRRATDAAEKRTN